MPRHPGSFLNATTIVARVKQQLGGLLWLNAKVVNSFYRLLVSVYLCTDFFSFLHVATA